MVQSYESLRSIHLDQLADQIGGRHRLTYLVSQRLRAISRGAPLLVERRDNEALIAAVCREISEGKIWIEMAAEEERAEENDFAIFGLDDEL